jgi:hypothetical protein
VQHSAELGMEVLLAARELALELALLPCLHGGHGAAD